MFNRVKSVQSSTLNYRAWIILILAPVKNTYLVVVVKEKGYSYDLAIVLRKCPQRIVDVARLVAEEMRSGGYRFLLVLEGPRFEECVDIVRRLTQDFISASFTVVEGRDWEGAERVVMVE